MKERKFYIVVYPDNSSAIFKSTCELIEKTFQRFKKHKLLIDVDGSTIQEFSDKETEIVVYDDYDVGVVCISSDVKVPITDFWASHRRLENGEIVSK